MPISPTPDVRPGLKSKNPIVRGMSKFWVFFHILGLFLFSLLCFLKLLISGNTAFLIAAIISFVVAVKFLLSDLMPRG